MDKVREYGEISKGINLRPNAIFRIVDGSSDVHFVDSGELSVVQFKTNKTHLFSRFQNHE